MKRDEALRSLSRDHHQALVVAQRMRRADDAEEGAAQFLDFFETHGQVHFGIEEQVLLPRWAELGEVDREAAARLAAEHLSIRTHALELQSEPNLESVRALGEELDAHVRFEERELFPAIERDLGEEELAVLARAVAAAEEAADRKG
jgi:hemerythrin-like domain-containing protein